MKFAIEYSPFGTPINQVQRIMAQVLMALVPGIIALFYYFGWGVIINIFIASLTALAAEALMLYLRRRPIKTTLSDLSALVTAVLFAIAIPPTLPWYLVMLGAAFAIIFVKHLYGGLGYNPFNPAMAAYVFLLISFPVDMTRWLPPETLSQQPISLSESLQISFKHQPSQGWDAITSATPLDTMRTQLDMNRTIAEIRQSPFWGDFGGKGWEWVANWFLLGGLFLIWKKTIDWRIPVAMILGLLIPAGLFWGFDDASYPFPAFHLFSGGFMLGAFFIATDPVTASTTPKGRWLYGFLIGLMIFIIRTWGGYPDAVAFSVLLLNMAAPTIDYFTQPRVFGQRERDDE